MGPKLRYVVRAVPDRLDMVDPLVRLIPGLEVSVDPNYARSDWSGRKKSTEHFLAVLRRVGADPCVHLEEDVILTRDFVSKCEAAVAAHPDRIVQMFSMRRADLTAGSRWDRTFAMNQCFYLPSGYGPILAEYVPQWIERAGADKEAGGYDTAMSAWLKARKEPYWLHVPSLVQHRVAVSAADPRRSSKRQSPSFVDPEPGQ